MAYSDIYEEGQKAFEENKSVSDYPSHYNKTQHKAWKDGYLEARHRDEVEKELGRWNGFSADCPWYERGLGLCKALSGSDNCCTKNNCAPLYFKESYYV